jgi:3-methylcrotonyl-CoA carboxylase alpha subunit
LEELMRRRVQLLGEHYDVTLVGLPGDWHLQVGDGTPLSVEQTPGAASETVVRLGDESAAMRVAVKGETAYVKAFGRTFALSVVDPVEQAAQETGGLANSARAPMPGVVVEIKVAVGDQVTRGQPLMIIESMKTLTVISSPRDGQVAEIHFDPGESFDKNAALVTLGSA